MRARQRAPSIKPAWVWGQTALEDSAGELGKLPGPYLLVGEASLLRPWRKRILGAWSEAGLETHLWAFPEGSECHLAMAEAIASQAKSATCRSLIAWGGGKCIDSVKWASLLAGLPLATVPSSAATCACATSVVVAHSVAGEVLEVLDLPAPPALCVADAGLLASAPQRCLAAGMADTLAKWLEWEAIEDPQGEGSAQALKARDMVLEPSTPMESLWEANLRLSAEASNWGFAPAAAAHSFCAGMSLDPRSLGLMHGEWVGLGLLFQARLRGEDTRDLRAWLSRLGLPQTLPYALSDAEALARRILREDESIHRMRGVAAPSQQDVVQTLQALRE
jgi:glycerol dehydrogenase-like iron-containing ADH family enzyme